MREKPRNPKTQKLKSLLSLYLEISNQKKKTNLKKGIPPINDPKNASP